MRSTRADWAVFFALGLMWGSSYLFIKIAVDDFGTFTLVALRLAIGAALLWTVLRLRGQPLPRDRRVYGHLFVMGLINITIPFLLITWAERSVESSLAAVLTSMVPLFTVVLAPLFIHDEPLRVNAVVGLAVGFLGVVVLTSRER
ncbi:MAG: EamA family transporter, partial [Chloroflexota bacterium]